MFQQIALGAAAAEAGVIGHAACEQAFRLQPVLPCNGAEGFGHVAHQITGRAFRIGNDVGQRLTVACHGMGQRGMIVDEAQAGIGEELSRISAHLAPFFLRHRLACQLRPVQDRRGVRQDVDRHAERRTRLDVGVYPLPHLVRVTQLQRPQRHMPGQMTMHDRLAVIVFQPVVEIGHAGLRFTGLIINVRTHMGAMCVARIDRHRAVDDR